MRRHISLLITSFACAILLCLTLLAMAATWKEALVLRSIKGSSEVRIHLHAGVCILSSSRDPGSSYYPWWNCFWSAPVDAELFVSRRIYAATTHRRFGPVQLASGTLGGAFTILRVPFWPLLLILPLPLIRLLFVARDLHRKRGRPLCPRCGYDLTGCIERCAECGWTMPYNLILRLALIRDARRRCDAPARFLGGPAPRAGRAMTEPTDNSVGSGSVRS